VQQLLALISAPDVLEPSWRKLRVAHRAQAAKRGSEIILRGSNPVPLMSAWGQKRTSDRRPLMSALPPKADIAHGGGNVRFVPILLQKSAMTGAWPVARRS
jgi:hypothetical protein